MSVVNVTQPTAEPGGDSTIVEGASSDASSSGDLARGTTIGRYVVLDRVGAGGMGVVYAAYDPELDRKVAVKVLHRVGQSESAQNVARARLLREAQALAKLPHPNVVAIHDVGTFAARAWIAMEFVTGQTMTAWLRAEQRHWTTVLDVLLAAGDGVAAAHAADLLHRDLKPDNIMIDDTGRVRVMDFGLARGRDLEATERSSSGAGVVSSGSMLALDVSAIGSLVGTPAYMAPEQLGATAATVASDQFAFCVTCWEALFGVRPFTGDSVHGHLAAMLDGPPRRGARSVPAWLRRVLERGLAIDPTARHRSMPALLRALRSGRVRARRRLAALGAAAALSVAAAAWGIRQANRTEALAACDDAAASIGTQWPGRAPEIDAAIRSARLAYGDATARALPRWLDPFVERWTETAATTCRALDIDRTMDAALRPRVAACLDAHGVRLTALLDAIAENPAAATQGAVGAATALPDPSKCADARFLATHPWSEDIDQVRVAELHAGFARADALAFRGQVQDARALDERLLGEAVELGWTPLVAEARMRLGARLSLLLQLADADATLRAAYFEALHSGADSVAAEASMWLVRTVGYQMGRHDDGLLWAAHGLAVLDRMGAASGPERASLDSMAALVHRERGDVEESRRLEDGVIALRREVLGEQHPDVASALEAMGNTLHLLGDNAAAATSHRRALAIRERVLGADHPTVAASLSNLANAVEDDEAEGLLLRALAIGEAAHGHDAFEIVPGLANLGGIHLAAGRAEQARTLYARALAIEESVLGPDHHEVAGSCANLGNAMLMLGDHDGAMRLFSRALTIAERRLPGDHPLIAQVHYNIGRAHADRGEDERAIESLQRAKLPLWASGNVEHALSTSLRLAHSLRRTGRIDEAQVEVIEVRTRHAQLAAPIDWILEIAELEEAELAAARGHHAEAIERFTAMLAEEAPDSLEAARFRFAIAMSRIASSGPSTEHIAEARAASAAMARHSAPQHELREVAMRLAAAEDAQSRRR